MLCRRSYSIAFCPRLRPYPCPCSKSIRFRNSVTHGNREHSDARSLYRQALRAFSDSGLWSHPRPPFARTYFLPETHAFGARLFDGLVNAVAALAVIRLNGVSVLYTGFIIIPQFDRL
jgi:hypothetical protein